MIRLSWRPLIALTFAIAMISSPTEAGWEIGDMAEVMDSTLRLRNSSGSPDGMGGMLLMAVDEGGSPARISVTRVDHNGSEVWGDNGFWLPIILDAVPKFWQTAVTHDGQGGGYFAFHDAYGGDDYLRVARVNSAGTWLWSIAIDNLGTTDSATNPRVQLVPTSNGEVIVVFTRFTGGPIHYSVRVDATGTILWHGPIHDSWGYDSYAIAKTDGLDGALIGYFRSDSTDEVRMQRLNGTTGVRAWGTDGALVWSGPVGGFEDIVTDGASGAYIVRSTNGVSYAQHLNSVGTKTWASEVTVHDTQTLYFAYSALPKICVDGTGGFVLFHGVEDMFAQRVGVGGNLLWPGGVTVASTVDVACHRSISPDGFGGAIVTYENSWLIEGSTYCDQVKGARVDAFGTVVWDDHLAICSFSHGGGGPVMHEAPHTPIGFGDGSGGGIFAWVVDDVDGPADPWLWGKGVDAGGNPPTPRVSFLQPDAAEPGAAGPYLILGDYLDLTLEYALEKEDGSETLALTPTNFTSHQMVGGNTTLTGLTEGPFHLQVDEASTPVFTFEFATGIGYPIVCDSAEPVIHGDRDIRLEGSQRQAVYTPDGRMHAIAIEYDPGVPQYSLIWWTYDGGWTEHASPFMTTSQISEPTLTMNQLGQLDMLFVLEISPTRDQLIYLRLDSDGTIVISQLYDAFEVIRNPVAGITDDGNLHVIMERGAAPGNDLLHVEHDGSSFSVIGNPTTNGSPRNPDLAVMNDRLELVWVSNSAIPGIQQMERTRYESSAWDTPEIVNLALGISSPSVAWDGDEQALYAWIVDNQALNGIPPLVYTQIRTEAETLA
ncbi:hypothetical protein DRQ32_06745, partial [bacterium]